MAAQSMGDGDMAQIVPVPPQQVTAQPAVSVASASALPTSAWGSITAPALPELTVTGLDGVLGTHLPAHLASLKYLYARIDQLHAENIRLNRSVSRLTSQLAATRVQFDNEVQSRNRHIQHALQTVPRQDIVDQARGQRGTAIIPDTSATTAQPRPRVTRARRA